MTASEQTRPPKTISRRARRRAFRPRRTIPAIVTAAALATAAILIATEVIAALLFHHPANVLPVAHLVRLGRDTHWDDPLALTVSGVVAALGLLLFLLALWPGHRRVIALACDDPDVVMGITALGLRRQIAQAAQSVDGITRARITVGQRRIQIYAVSPFRDTRGLAEQVHHAVTERLDQLAPLRLPRLRITVRHRKD